MITSAAETPSSSWMSTGMPRPLSGTVTEPSALQDDLDPVAIAGQRLVDRVVDDLEHHVVQAGAVVGVADVHARPLAHGLEASQHLDRVGVVDLGAGRHGGCRRRSWFWLPKVVRRCDRASATWKTCARPASGANSAASVPVSQACRRAPRSSSNSAARRSGSRWAATSSSSRTGGAAARSAAAAPRPGRSTISRPSAGRSSPRPPAGRGRDGDRRSLRCGPGWVPVCGVARGWRPAPRRSRSSASSAGMSSSQPSTSPAMASAGAGTGRRPPRRGVEPLRRCRRRAAAIATPWRASRLERVSQAGSRAAVAQQPRALAQRVLVGGHAAGMLRDRSASTRRSRKRRRSPAPSMNSRSIAASARRLRMLAERGLAARPAGRRSARPGAAAASLAAGSGRCRSRAGPPACRASPRPPRQGVRLVAAAGGRARRAAPGAGRGPGARTRSPPAGWSCRRRSAPVSTTGSGPQSSRSWR